MKQFVLNSHFSGCGGSAWGAKKAGFIIISGLEWDEKRPQIAELYRNNFDGELIYQDISEFDFRKSKIPSLAERRMRNIVLVTHTSPPCQDFSVSNKKRNVESKRAKLLEYTHDFYSYFVPEYIILENVKLYKKSKVYRNFKDFLKTCGYKIYENILNAADFGAAESRERLFMIAAAPGYDLPDIIPSHIRCPNRQQPLFALPWVGWHQAIADIISELEPSKLTDAQIKSINKNHKTIEDAILVSFANTSGKSTYTTSEGGTPSFTITASIGEHNAIPKIFLPNTSILVQRVGYRDLPKTRTEGQPCWTLLATLCDDGKGKDGNTRNKVIDAFLPNGEVKNLNTKALARIHGFDDQYQWSGDNRIDVRGIGNSVCPPVMFNICEAIKIAANNSENSSNKRSDKMFGILRSEKNLITVK